MIHLDTVTWLIIAIVFLFLVVGGLGMAIYESNQAIKLAVSLSRTGIEGLREDIKHLELRLEEMHHIEAEP